MSTDTRFIEQYMNKENINHCEYNEFNDIEEDIGNGLVSKGVYRANWSGKSVGLKSFSLDNDTVKDIVRKIKLHQNCDCNNNIIKFYGVTKTDSGEHLLVTEYPEGGTLRDYQGENFLSLSWHDKLRLALQLSMAIGYLHENGIVHNDLHSNNVLIQRNSIKLVDSRFSKRVKNTNQISIDTIPYIDPQGTREKSLGEDKLKKSDVYSAGVLLWELSSGKKPFADREYDLFLAMEIARGLREGVLEGTPEEYSNLYSNCWNGDPDERPTIQDVIKALTSMKSQQIIQQLKLNHGLFFDGCNIEPSKQAVFLKDGVLHTSLYKGQPLVYTSINDRSSHTNIDLNEDLQPSDICINFPISEITYNSDLLESFSSFTGDDEASYRMYGHLFAKKVLVGGKLFIDFTSTQIDSFKSLLLWMHNSVKHNKENPFKNLSVLNHFPKIRTSDGEELNTPKKLADWMNKLYQKNMADIISYNDLIPISELRSRGFSEDTPHTFNEKQPGIANFKEKLTLEEWVKDSIYVNLTDWIKKFRLLQGLMINKDCELGISEKTAINFVQIPKVDSSDKFYSEMIKPMTTLEEFLITNNIFSIKDDKKLDSFPFIKQATKPEDSNYGDYTQFLVKCERYKILSNMDDIKPSEELKRAIEKALKSMKPFTYLRDVFEEFGHFYPLSIVFGKSLKNFLLNSNISNTIGKISLESPIFESLKSRLDDLRIPCLSTQEGNIIEENNLSDWIQNINGDLEIIELNDIISLYDILEAEQQREIDIILNRQDNYKIIMSKSVDLKDLDIRNTEHCKRINVEPSLEDKNYEVFGSIISKDNLKLEDVFVTFGSYDVNGFSATIKTSKNTNVNITECYILWVIIGNPSKLSVFSPKNREIQVECIKESITLQRNNSYYSIKTTRQLSQGFVISVNTYCFNPVNIKLIGWSKYCMNFQIVEPNYNSSSYNSISSSSINSNIDSPTNIEVSICILPSDYKSAKVDNKNEEYSLDLIGYALTEKNFSEVITLGKSNAQKYINQRYPTKEEREKETKLTINKQNLEGHLDLSDFVNLEGLNCSDNQLTSLDISKNTQLVELDCSYNQLNDIKLPTTNKIEYLNLLDNSFSQNLSCFSRLANLKQLFIGNTDEGRIQKGIYNQFFGSLEHLKNLTKLESLCINNTDIDSDLKSIPDSVKNLRCLADKRVDAKVKKIYDQLEMFATDAADILQGRYNFRAWKEYGKLVKEKDSLQSQLEELTKQFSLSVNAQLTELKLEENNLQTKQGELGLKKIQLENNVKTLQKQVTDLKVKLEQTEDIYKQTRKQLEEREEKLKSFKSFTTEQIIEKECLEKEANDLKDKLLIKEKEKKQYEEQLEGTMKELKTKKEKSADLQNQLAELESSMASVHSKKVELSGCKKTLDNLIYSTKDSTASMRKKIDHLKGEISSKEKLMVEAKKIKNELEETKKNEKDLQEERNRLLNLLEEHRKDKQNFQDKLDSLESKLKNKEASINGIQQQKEREICELTRQLKETELKGLINTIDRECDLGKAGKRLLEKLLSEYKIILTNDNSPEQKLEGIKQELSEDYELDKKRIQNLLKKQKEITRLETQLKSFQNQNQEL